MVTRTNFDFTLKDCSLGGVRLAKKADRDKYVYSVYSIGFNSLTEYSLSDGSVGKNIIIFGDDLNLCVHIDNKGKDNLNSW